MRKVWIVFFLIAGCSNRGEYHPLQWRVGQWVSYEINGKPLQVSVVGRDSFLFWVETVEPEIIVKVLVEEGELANPKRVIIKEAGEETVEFRVDEISVKSGLSSLKIGKSTSGKKELLTLPCGKFKVFHIKQNGKEVWVSNKIPIFGIAKYKSDDKAILLRDYGLHGAKSEIKGVIKIRDLEEAS